MRNHLITSSIILILFLAMFYKNSLGVYLQNGIWLAGITEAYVFSYIAILTSVCFLVAFKPKLKLIYELTFIPLASSLVCKSLSVLLLCFHIYLNLKTTFISITGLFIAGILFFYCFQLNGNGRLVTKYALFLVLALLPISYEFSFQMLQHKSYP